MKINFASTKLAFFLIAILAILIILSAIIPQKDISDDRIIDLKELLGDGYVVIEKLKLDEIYTSPYFFILLGFLIINMAAGNIRRFKIVYKTEKTLLKARHLGSIIFHLSLIFTLLSVILNYLYRHEVVYALTEGQALSNSQTSYLREFSGPAFTDSNVRYQLRLVTVNESYEIEGSFTRAADISLLPENNPVAITATVLTNHPLKWNNLEFHIGPKSGYSPELLINDATGKSLFKSFVRLASRKIEGKTFHYDYIVIGETDIKIDITVLSDTVILDSPEYQITVHEDERLLCDTTLTDKEIIDCEDFKISIPRLRRWCYISAVESPFQNWIFFGFWIALAGMTIGFIPRLLENKSRRK
ncbi:MAG: cytochrome c biogenesis protein ResB [candidate division Zixibacteria bacterium]